MTKEELTLGTGSVVRHLMTAGAGALAAHGLAAGDQLTAFGSAAAVLVATLAWSFIEKSKLLASVVAALPLSEIESLASDLIAFKAKGSNPLLISHMANTLLQVANAELVAAHPELVAPPPTTEPADPAPAPVSPPVQEPAPLDLNTTVEGPTP